MKKDYLVKAKVNKTLYFDYDGDYWDSENPKMYYPEMRAYRDYDVMKKGTVLYFNYDTECKRYVGLPKVGSRSIAEREIQHILNSPNLDVLEIPPRSIGG